MYGESGIVSSQPVSAKTTVYSTGTITIRNLTDTPEDTVFVGKLVVEAYKESYIRATSKESLPKVIEGSIKEHKRRGPIFYERTFVAEYNGQRAGILTLKFHGDQKNEYRGEYDSLGCCDSLGLSCFNLWIRTEHVPVGKCYLGNICIEEKLRGKGIGKVLLDFAEKEARNKGCDAIYLWVTIDNPAKNLYMRQGYTIQKTKSYCFCGLWCMIGEWAAHRMIKQL